MSAISFIKMHGLGNDFVVIDGRPSPVSLTPDQARAIAARHTGIGCDQVIVVEPPDSGRDGSGAEAGGVIGWAVAPALPPGVHRWRVRLGDQSGGKWARIRISL